MTLTLTAQQVEEASEAIRELSVLSQVYGGAAAKYDIPLCREARTSLLEAKYKLAKLGLLNISDH